MSASATLVYRVTPTSPMSLDRTQAALAAIALSTSDMANFGATLTSDTTTNDGTNAIRTIVFNITSAFFQQNFPDATAQASTPFNQLYTSEIAGALGMTVETDPPIIA